MVMAKTLSRYDVPVSLHTRIFPFLLKRDHNLLCLTKFFFLKIVKDIRWNDNIRLNMNKSLSSDTFFSWSSCNYCYLFFFVICSLFIICKSDVNLLKLSDQLLETHKPYTFDYWLCLNNIARIAYCQLPLHWFQSRRTLKNQRENLAKFKSSKKIE